MIDGGGQTVVPLSIALLGEDRLVELRYAGLPAGGYEIAIDGPTVTDRAGNALAAGEVTSAFTLTGDAIQWINRRAASGTRRPTGKAVSCPGRTITW